MKFKIAILTLCTVFIFSCTKDLDRSPKYGLTAATLYKDLAGYKSSLAKVYAGFALSGNSGPHGSSDVSGLDEGFGQYLRAYWNLQELPTDEAVIGWNDRTIKDFHEMDWTPADDFLAAMYSRIFFTITVANAFIAESDPAKVSGRGISGNDAEQIKAFRAEARYLRALAYSHALDFFGNPILVTEVGGDLPKQTTRQNLFNFIESELKEIESQLPAPRQNEYARADQASLWMLLASLYLNAKVYTGTERYTDAIAYSLKVINAGYTLEPNYAHLFMADNHRSREIIFPITFDGTNTRTWGGTTYIINASIGGNMNSLGEFGTNEKWGGLRTTKALVQKFPDPNGTVDKRAMFHTSGQSLEITDIGEFSHGYAVKKWKNKTSTGGNGSSLVWADTDFPLFRLGEAYLIYAEAVLRGGTGGDINTAVNYINALRQRAYGNTSGNITSAQLTLDFILDERARELYWEAKRRTDLIRYDRFTTGTYLWPWKGGVAGGAAVGAHRNLYPIPAAEINANPNIKQNPGY